MAETRVVLIAGAGPTGLTAAMELSRLGVPVRLVDRAEGPTDTSRALAVQARTMELLAQRGLAEAMLAKGNRGRATTIYSNGKTVGRIDLSLIPSRFNFITLIPQSDTEGILRGQVERQGVTVEWRTELVALAQSAGHGGEATAEEAEKYGVRAVLRRTDGSLEEVRAAWMIDAEGAHSTVRATLDLKFPGKSLPHSYALADLHLQGPVPEDELSIFLPASGLMAVFPMSGQRFRMICTDDSERQGDPTLEHMQGLWDRSSHLSARLHDMVWSSSFRINSRVLDHLRVGRIFFAGDAAHVHSPAGGQGMNTGIQDVINLAWKLALVYHGRARATLLETYEAERLPVIEALVKVTEGATDAFASDTPGVHAAVRLLMPAVLHSETVQQTATRTLGQVAVRYDTSPLTQGGGSFCGAKAGERLDPACVAAGLDPSRLTAVCGASRMEEVRGALAGWSAEVAVVGCDAACDGAEEVALLRPDGHIAVISRHPADLGGWLRRWLPLPS